MKELMWQFKTANFTVCAYISSDEDLDLSWDETGEVREKLESGEYQAFQTEVHVRFNGCDLGSDYLGGSIYHDPRDFFTEHHGLAVKSRADGCTYGSYFCDMVREAIGKARRNMSEMLSVQLHG